MWTRMIGWGWIEYCDENMSEEHIKMTTDAQSSCTSRTPIAQPQGRSIIFSSPLGAPRAEDTTRYDRGRRILPVSHHHRTPIHTLPLIGFCIGSLAWFTTWQQNEISLKGKMSTELRKPSLIESIALGGGTSKERYHFDKFSSCCCRLRIRRSSHIQLNLTRKKSVLCCTVLYCILK